MALHPSFPTSPYAPLIPEQRWFPADETLRATAYEKLLPPLVANIRKEVFAWRNDGYAGASATSKALLQHWFETEHLIEAADGSLSGFNYYFAQREAVETVIWLYEVRQARDKFDLIRFDASGAVSSGMFDEDWPRYVVKMATGAGKTKVLALLIAWSFFHKLYEADSTLSRNFLVIAPNIIVLDRLRADFDGLKIFFNDPILPDNGHEGHNWRDDFQITLHIQDEVRIVRDVGNLFLTNIHRVFLGDVSDHTLEDDDLRDYFLAPFGPKPAKSFAKSRNLPYSMTRRITTTIRKWRGSSPSRTFTIGCCKRIVGLPYRLMSRPHRVTTTGRSSCRPCVIIRSSKPSIRMSSSIPSFPTLPAGRNYM
jgi:type III restriction enzyme